MWPLRLAGMMCYSLYLWHFVGIDRLSSPGWSLEQVPAYLAFTAVLSAITHRLVEFPAKRARDLFAGERSPG